MSSFSSYSSDINNSVTTDSSMSLNFSSNSHDKKGFLTKKVLPTIKKIGNVSGKVTTITGKVATIAAIL